MHSPDLISILLRASRRARRTSRVPWKCGSDTYEDCESLEDGLLTTSGRVSALPFQPQLHRPRALRPVGYSNGVFNFEQPKSYELPS